MLKNFFERIFKNTEQEGQSQRIVVMNFGEIGKIAEKLGRLNHVKAYSADIGCEMPVIVVEADNKEFDINKAKIPEQYNFDGKFLTNKGHVMIGFTSNFKVFYRTKNDELVRIMEKKE